MGLVTTPGPRSTPHREFYKYNIYIRVGDTLSLVVDHTELRRFPSGHGGYVDRRLFVRRARFSAVPQPPCVYTARGRPYYKYSILLQDGDILYVDPDNGKDNPWVVMVKRIDKHPWIHLDHHVSKQDIECLPCPPFFFQTMGIAYGVWE